MTETPQNAEPVNIPLFINELFFVRCDQYFSQNAQLSERKENEVLFLMPVSILFQHRSLSSLPHRAVLEAVQSHPQLRFIPSQEDLDEIEKESVRYSIEIRMQTEKQTFMVKVDCDEDTSVEKLTEELAKFQLSASKTEETQSKRGFFVYFENKKTADETLLKLTQPFSATLLTSPPPTLSSFSKYRHTYNANAANLSGAKGPSNLFIPGQQSQTQQMGSQTQQTQLQNQTQTQTQTDSQSQSQFQPQLQNQTQPQTMAVPGLFFPNQGYCYVDRGNLIFSEKPYFTQNHPQQIAYGQQYQQRQNHNQNNYRQNRQNQNQNENENQNQNQNQNQNSNRFNRKKGKGNNRMKGKRNGFGNIYNGSPNISNTNNPNDKRDNMPKRSVETSLVSFPPISQSHNVKSGYEYNDAVKKYSITETQQIIANQFAIDLTDETPKPSLILMPDALCVSQTPLHSIFSEQMTEKTSIALLPGPSATKTKSGASYADILRANSPKNANAIMSSSNTHSINTSANSASTSSSSSASSSSASAFASKNTHNNSNSVGTHSNNNTYSKTNTNMNTLDDVEVDASVFSNAVSANERKNATIIRKPNSDSE